MALYTVVVLALLGISVVHGLFLDDSPCDLWPSFPSGISYNSNLTVDIQVPTECKNGTFRWDYPRGHVMLHFPNTNRIECRICFGDYLIGDVLRIVDVTQGKNFTLPHFDREAKTQSCTHVTDADEILIRIDAKHLVYVAGLDYTIES